MKRLTGRFLDFVLLILCFTLIIVVIPNWICISLAVVVLIMCAISLIGSGLFK